jgi:hypothetical protein
LSFWAWLSILAAALRIDSGQVLASAIPLRM